MGPRILFSLGLVAATLAALWGVLGNAFINYDDPDYILSNPLIHDLSPDGLTRMATSFSRSNWHPLTWLSHAVDLKLFGTNPTGHHAHNLALHGANALLLFLALVQATKRAAPSFLVALLFAVHPLRVESVAWAAERKDLLSAFFAFAVLAVYPRRTERRGFAGVALLAALFAASLAAKQMYVTLPFVLLLFDYWPLGRVNGKNAWPRTLEKAPLFLLAAAGAALAWLAQSGSNTTATLAESPLAERIPQALFAYVAYLGKTVWPLDLAVHYPLRVVSLGTALGCFGLLAAISLLVWRLRTRTAAPLVGWLVYLGALVPVIGIVRIGEQAFADRYSYFPQVGLWLGLVFGLDALLGERGKRLSFAGLSAAALLCIGLTRHQVEFWRDSETLFRRASLISPDSAQVRFSLANALLERGKAVEGEIELRKALELQPNFAEARNNLGNVLAARGDFPGAAQEFLHAAKARPDLAVARNNLGLALLNVGDFGGAEAEFLVAERLNPELWEPSLNLAQIYERNGRLDLAEAAYRRALTRKPDFPPALGGLGGLLARTGRFAEGVRLLERALDAAPDSLPLLVDLAAALAPNDPKRAAALLERALAIRPDAHPALVNLALIQLRLGRTAEALGFIDRALAQRPNDERAKAIRAAILASSSGGRNP